MGRIVLWKNKLLSKDIPDTKNCSDFAPFIDLRRGIATNSCAMVFLLLSVVN